MELVYQKAGIEDLDILTETRIEVLRAANGLPGSADMGEVKKAGPPVLSKGAPGRYARRLSGMGWRASRGLRRRQLLSGHAHLSQSQRGKGVYHEYVYASRILEKGHCAQTPDRKSVV